MLWFHIFQTYLKNTKKKNSKTKSHQEDIDSTVKILGNFSPKICDIISVF